MRGKAQRKLNRRLRYFRPLRRTLKLFATMENKFDPRSLVLICKLFNFCSGFDRVMIIAPIILRHKINERSPLYSYSKSNFSRHDFEIVVIVEGAVEQTGMTTQMRTSYTPDEILWGHYFK